MSTTGSESTTVRKSVYAPGTFKPAAPYSPAVQVDKTLFVSGQLGVDASGRLVPGGIEGQGQCETARSRLRPPLCILYSQWMKIYHYLVNACSLKMNLYHYCNCYYIRRAGHSQPARHLAGCGRRPGPRCQGNRVGGQHQRVGPIQRRLRQALYLAAPSSQGRLPSGGIAPGCQG